MCRIYSYLQAIIAELSSISTVFVNVVFNVSSCQYSIIIPRRPPVVKAGDTVMSSFVRTRTSVCVCVCVYVKLCSGLKLS